MVAHTGKAITLGEYRSRGHPNDRLPLTHKLRAPTVSNSSRGRRQLCKIRGFLAAATNFLSKLSSLYLRSAVCPPACMIYMRANRLYCLASGRTDGQTDGQSALSSLSAGLGKELDSLYSLSFLPLSSSSLLNN